MLALKKISAHYAVQVLLTERLKALGASPFTTYLNQLVERGEDVASLGDLVR